MSDVIYFIINPITRRLIGLQNHSRITTSFSRQLRRPHMYRWWVQEHGVPTASHGALNIVLETVTNMPAAS
jgi:hypothetical protein